MIRSILKKDLKRKKTMKEKYYDNPDSIYHSDEFKQKCSEHCKRDFDKDHYCKMSKAAWENEENYDKMNPGRFNSYLYDKRCTECGAIRKKCSLNANKCPECGKHTCKEMLTAYDKETKKKVKINIVNRNI